MAPTVCMNDIPMPGTDAPSVRRKCWQDRESIRHSRLGAKQLVKNESWEGCYPESFLQGAKMPDDQSERFKLIMKRRRGLLEIVARTVALVRRNHILQKRVDALRLETQDFIQSVLNNPANKDATKVPNRTKRETDSPNEDDVSSTTDDMEVDNTRQTESPRTKPQSHVTSTCILSDGDSPTDSH